MIFSNSCELASVCLGPRLRSAREFVPGMGSANHAGQVGLSTIGVYAAELVLRVRAAPRDRRANVRKLKQQ